jgi:NitT/TauT family transport system permease protein
VSSALSSTEPTTPGPARQQVTSQTAARLGTIGLGIAGIVLVGVVWELLKASGGVDKEFLGMNTDDASMPHLSTIWGAFFEEEIRGQGRSVFRSVLAGSWFSFRLAVGGFVVGSALGLLLAMVMQRFKLVERAWLPYIVLSQTVPLIALAPLIAGWGGQIKLFGYQWTGWMSVVGMASYLSFFPVTIGALRGLKSPKPHSVELMQSYAASWWQTFTKLRLPSAVPHLMPAFKLGAAASVVGAVVSEISIGLSGGIGRLILEYFQKASGDPSRVFTAFIGAAVLGLVVAGLVTIAERVLTRNLSGSRLTEGTV